MESDAATILVVEDHVLTRRFLIDNLVADGYDALAAGCLAEAEPLLQREYPDLAIVDLGLPDGDGLELLRRVRAADGLTLRVDPELPLLVLSGRTSELDRLRGFERGADDYMVKPFSYQELRARIGAVLARSRRRPSTRRLRIGPLELDPVARDVHLGGARVRLSKKEYALLRALAVEPTRVFTREELLRSVWGFPAHVPTRTLDSHAFRLRRKLGGPDSPFVINVWGVGYRLIDGDVE
jgi:DNA-binding response OmpR family regulator